MATEERIISPDHLFEDEETVNRAIRPKTLADYILESGWYPEQIIRINPSENTILIEEWCEEKLLGNWTNYNGYYWLFEDKKEALYFKTVW